MGILLLNIVSFAMPDAAYMNPRAYGGWHGADLAVWLVNFVLFDGKMRGLFSLLFGASLLLVADRAEASGRSAARVHYARMLWLLAFGLAHLWLVWSGDILTLYALVGMLAFGLRRLPPERMVILGVMLVLLGTLVFASLPATVAQLRCCAASPAEAARYARDLAGLTNSFGVPAPAEIAHELALYRGGYGEIVAHRFAANASSPLTMFLFFGPETLGYMLFGMAALRSGMVRGAWSRARYRRWLFLCWGIALPGYAALAGYLLYSGFDLFAVTLAVMALSAPLRPPMILGWVCLILLLARPDGALTRRIAAAGRMAFTNYLATSLICATLFYGYGLGWYGHLARWQLYLVVAAIWLAMLLWSMPWLVRFRFGPFEWLWRSLSRGSPQRMRR